MASNESKPNRLDGIAVPDAVRLNDAVVDLTDAIRSGPELDATETEILLKFDSNDPDTLREFQVREIAMHYVRDAIQTGTMTLYTMLQSGAYPIDRYALRELNFRTLRRGTYEPNNRIGDPLAGAALWVLRNDWKAFRQTLLARRSGYEARPNSKGGRPTEHNWEAVKQLAEAALREQPSLTRSKLAESLVSEETLSPIPPAKRTIEKKLRAWGLGAAKPIRP